MKEKLSIWYKSRKIPLLGISALFLIITSLTITFNWFWSGLGTDPTKYIKLPLTKSETEFKDYATLYIALLSFGASLFSGLVVFLVFNGWKNQHNKNIDAKYYDQALQSFKNISITVRKFKTLYEECNYISKKNMNIDIQFFQNKYKNYKNDFLLNLDIFQSELIFLQTLNKDSKDHYKIEDIFQNYIIKSKEKMNEKDIDFSFYNSYTNYKEFEEDLRKSSEDQASLIINNIKSIVNFLESKIKA